MPWYALSSAPCWSRAAVMAQISVCALCGNIQQLHQVVQSCKYGLAHSRCRDSHFFRELVADHAVPCGWHPRISGAGQPTCSLAKLGSKWLLISFLLWGPPTPDMTWQALSSCGSCYGPGRDRQPLDSVLVSLFDVSPLGDADAEAGSLPKIAKNKRERERHMLLRYVKGMFQVVIVTFDLWLWMDLVG